jgi:2-oxoglutarate dehydrogenase E2 component (dihydrolipoamide succinyltransferase)
MAKVEISMPKLGESVMEATITKWLVGEGEAVALDQVLVEIATDKVDSEVPSTEKGILVKRLFNEGDVVSIGTPFAIIETEASVSLSDSTSTQPVVAEEKALPVMETVPFVPVASVPVASQAVLTDNRFYSPLVKTIASAEKVSSEELSRIPGTGLENRVTKQDLLSYIKNRGNGEGAVQPVSPSQPSEVSSPPVAHTIPKTAVAFSGPKVTASGEDTVVEMDRMRKLIAQHMVHSKQTSPHVTSYVEADVTHMVRWREKNKDEFFRKHGEKITYTPIIMEAVAQAIREFPGVNASVNGTPKWKFDCTGNKKCRSNEFAWVNPCSE